MPTETAALRTFEDVAEVTRVDRYSRGEKAGILKGDMVLEVGKYAPSDVVANPDLWDKLGRTDWITLRRKEIVFRFCPGNALDGIELEPRPAVEGPDVPEENWTTFHAGVQAGYGLLLLPEVIAPVWSMVPIILYARFRLWQMVIVTALFYGLALAVDPMVFAVTYLVSVIMVALGGPNLLRDASAAHGFHARGRISVSDTKHVPALEVITAEIQTVLRAEAAQQKPA